MPDPSTSDNPEPDAHGAVHTVSFRRLQEEGAGALGAAPDLHIRAVFLVEASHRWFSAYNLVTCRRADDLFQAAQRFPEICELFPNGAEVLALTLEFIFDDNPEPCRVVLQPPHRLEVQRPSFRDRLELFLARSGLVQTTVGPTCRCGFPNNL